MSYREAYRSRQTCRWINEIIRLNAKKLSFPVERIAFMFYLYTDQSQMVGANHDACGPLMSEAL